MFTSATDMTKCMDQALHGGSESCPPHLAVRPAQFNFIHPPQFVDVLRQLVSNFLQVRRQDNLKGGAEKGLSLFTLVISMYFCCLYLAGFNRCGDEGGLGQELCSAQQVSHPAHVPLVLFYWLHFHLLFGQQRLITRGIARGRQEFKVAVSAAQQETNPNGVKGRPLGYVTRGAFYRHIKNH